MSFLDFSLVLGGEAGLSPNACVTWRQHPSPHIPVDRSGGLCLVSAVVRHALPEAASLLTQLLADKAPPRALQALTLWSVWAHSPPLLSQPHHASELSSGTVF